LIELGLATRLAPQYISDVKFVQFTSAAVTTTWLEPVEAYRHAPRRAGEIQAPDGDPT